MNLIQKDIESQIQNMSSLSHTVPKIVQVVNDVSSSARDLVKVIQMDPVLTAKVLRIVNSAFYSVQQEVTSLNKAVIMVGMNTVKNLALSTAVVSSFSFDENQCGIKHEEFWKYSVGTAVLSKLLAQRSRLSSTDSEDLFIIGLLHVIGKAFLLQFFPKQIKEIVADCKEQEKLSQELEIGIFGISHMQIGATLARNWKLPESVLDGIQYYAEPSVSKLLTTKYLSVASNAMKVNKIGFAGDTFPHLKGSDILSELAIDEHVLEEIVSNNLNGELEKANAFLKSN
tara:strand:- start:1136 stop:1990 length:855 start_codon:yes stop_codon:yes gene_type:complete